MNCHNWIQIIQGHIFCSEWGITQTTPQNATLPKDFKCQERLRPGYQILFSESQTSQRVRLRNVKLSQ